MNGQLEMRSVSAEHEPRSAEEAELARLRSLLLGDDYERLSAMRADIDRLLALRDELGDTTKQTSRVADVLSEAVLLPPLPDDLLDSFEGR